MDSGIEPHVWVTIRDNGPGIPPEILPKIFDPFFTTKRPGRGTGLGLSICMAIIREHNGGIEARSLPEGGAMFRVYLPVRYSDSQSVSARRREAAAENARPASFVHPGTSGNDVAAARKAPETRHS
jgi:hypothetical protein